MQRRDFIRRLVGMCVVPSIGPPRRSQAPSETPRTVPPLVVQVGVLTMAEFDLIPEDEWLLFDRVTRELLERYGVDHFTGARERYRYELEFGWGVTLLSD